MDTMTLPTGSSPQATVQTGLPRGEILGRYDSYLDAQKVVDYLADHDFPVAGVSIIGNDLKTVERVTAKLSYPKVALAGAAQGAMFGIFVGLILSIFGPDGGLTQILSSVGLGMAIWMIVGVVSYSFRKGKRDFSSSSQVMATNYDVVVAFEHAANARQLAAKLPMSRVEAPGANPAWAPPRQGAGPAHGAGDGAAGAPRPDGGGQPSTPEQGAADQPAARPATTDLPDGRPQYGIRVDPAQLPPASAPDAGDQDPNREAGPAGATPDRDPADGGDAPRR